MHLQYLSNLLQPPQHLTASENAIILFDGVCNLCSSSVQQVLKYDKAGYFHFASLQGETGQRLLQQHQLPLNAFNSFVLIENGIAFTRSTAALKVAKKLSGLYKILYPLIIVPRFIRDAMYDLVARNRYKWFGKKEACWLPKPEWKNRFLP
jgi:predicted DCC family thiol-disulfide oxidoreductase YuxK